jgi:prolyl-tRNA editing enzyme YbaK/EbsC (Cys-tRNA(Pro) deacylase)
LLLAIQILQTASFSFGSLCFCGAHRRSKKTLAMTSQEIDMHNSTLIHPPLFDLDSSLSFSLDPVQDESRRVAFERLVATISSLGGEIVSNTIALEKEGPHVVHVNSLVFQVTGSDPILLVVPNTDKVSTTSVEELLADERITGARLAPADIVEEVCGFPPGSVPPLGHSPTSMRTIVDRQLLNVDTLWGGGGHPGLSSLIKTETLLNLDHVETADIATRSTDAVNSDSINGDYSFMQRERPPKPFFPVAPPPLAIAEKVCTNRNTSNPLKPIPVTIIGRITGVRQMAKRLVFADLAPPHHLLDSEDDRPWRSGLDGKEMSVQLIAGKTLCKALGDTAGPAALRHLKRGQLILVEGKTNVGNRDSLRNWVDKQSLDIVVFAYKVLEEGTTTVEASPSNIQSNTELRRLQLAASVPPPLSPHPRPPSPESKRRSSSYLSMNDVFPASDDSPPVTVVDSIDSVNEFATKISHLLLSLTTGDTANGEENYASEGIAVPGLDKVGLIGMDCEWRPSFLAASPAEPQPIMLLQISVHPLKRVYLFDTQALFRPLLNPSETMTELESAASQTLVDVFSSQRLIKVGFQLGADLRRLASSFPHIPAFRLFEAVVEVSSLAKKAMQLNKERNLKYHTASLARVSEFLLGKTVDKAQQVSDWAIRPLSEEQIEYAALDAAVSPLLLEKSLQMANAGIITANASRSSSFLQVGRFEDDTMYNGAVISWRFFLLDTNEPAAIRKLKAKRIVGDPYVVTQRWDTGGKPPMKPSVPSRQGEGPYTDVFGVFRMPSKLVRITSGKDPSTLVDHLVGHRTGRSKEKCVDSLLTGEAALPNGAKVELHQRSGYVEFADGVALFVNMPDKSYKRGYPNEWLDDGKYMTWYLRKSDWNDGTSYLAQKLIQSNREESESPSVPVLFVRMAKGIFLCCGRCRAIVDKTEVPQDEKMEDVHKTGDWGLVQVRLQLLDREKLQSSDEFVSMVKEWPDGRGTAKSSVDGDELLTKDDSDKPAKNAIAEAVLSGDIVGGLSLAVEQASIPPEKRSIKAGLLTLRQQLANDISENAAKALHALLQVGGGS